jgi:hypothetical protein
VIPTQFTVDDGERAHAEWGSNCGPGALAAILGLTLDRVRPLLRGFEDKHYVNPTMMFDALARYGGLRWGFQQLGKATPNLDFPEYGLARIQWEGPWTEPGVPMRVRYRYTHWVGAKVTPRGTGIFDINALANGSGWCALEDWEGEIVPRLVALYARASGRWHITHAVKVQEPTDQNILRVG